MALKLNVEHHWWRANLCTYFKLTPRRRISIVFVSEMFFGLKKCRRRSHTAELAKNRATATDRLFEESGGSENVLKVDRTPRDPPKRRMHTAARNNGTTYKLKKSWP